MSMWTRERREAEEGRLSSFDAGERRAALEALAGAAHAGEIALPPARDQVNLHAHTFYSYNAYGYSPSAFAWMARTEGLSAAGIVDFDVLDGVDEFLGAARRLDLRGVAGLETRVFIPEFASRVINSPGEPGVSYHMGVGFTASVPPPPCRPFLQRIRRIGADRNRGMVERVNAFLRPVELDYDRDVLPLTPSGNATERHLCLAYARRAAALFPDLAALTGFWTDKLTADASKLDLPEGPDLQARIRARTMKKGGAGYVRPEQGAFPGLAETNRFIAAAGAIPTMTWLDGTSDGEAAIDELLDVETGCGSAVLNIIPDRNFTPGVRDRKRDLLEDIIGRARARGLPIVVGTEMNAPGNRFVDRFESDALRPFWPVFREGAMIVFAHTVLQAAGEMGYLSDWARRRFPSLAQRNEWFAEAGSRIPPSRVPAAGALDPSMTPDDVLRRAGA
jgi:hypothetical protein